MTKITIPNRFESLQATFGEEVRPLIVPIDKDLKAFVRMAEQSRTQAGGLLCFLLGPSGIGKTTAVHSTSANLPEKFLPVIPVPPSVPLRQVMDWLQNNVKANSEEKTQLILFDGREVSDDKAGLKEFLSGLNQFLRRAPKTLFLWPTTDAKWLGTIREFARTIGGENFAPAGGEHIVVGPDKKEWAGVLDRLLLQFNKHIADVGLGADWVANAAHNSVTIGDFLTKVGTAISERVAKTQEIKHLPQLIFVVSSSGDVVGEANRIRRAGTQSLAAEPLISYSPRSEAGKWWIERNKNANHHLGYILSLFQANLLTVTASCVVHACLQHGEADLREAATDAGARADRGNAARTLEASEVYRYLKHQQVPEYTSGRKGGPLAETVAAYDSIQSKSAKRHKAINHAICDLVAENVEGFKVAEDKLEVCWPGNDLISDACLEFDGKTLILEFHHLSSPSCNAASISSYIMDKLRNYAIYHQLIPR